MTAEQFLDAVWMLTGTAPAKPVAPASIPAFPTTTPAERRFVRATLVNADDLMRSLGRPNREQVVTTRRDQLTTLQALDLSNGQIMTDTLARGAANILKANPKLSPDELVDWVFLRALSRKPAAGERVAARELLGGKPSVEHVADLLWAIVMLPEFQLVRECVALIRATRTIHVAEVARLPLCETEVWRLPLRYGEQFSVVHTLRVGIRHAERDDYTPEQFRTVPDAALNTNRYPARWRGRGRPTRRRCATWCGS